MAEQTLFSKNAEVQAAQRKLDSLKSDINKKTARLLAEQAKTYRSEGRKLQLDIDEANETLTSLAQDIIGLKDEKRQLSDTVIDLKLKVDVDIARVESTKKEYAAITESLQRLRDETEVLVTERLTLERSLSELQVQKSALVSSMEKNMDALQSTEKQLAHTEASYASEKGEKAEKIYLLDVKILENTQIIERQQQEEIATRMSLATWQKTLDERDQNLRIREQKVNDGEQKLVRNSTLLDL